MWNIRPWEAATPLALVLGWAGLSVLFSPAARRNRAKLRRQRRSEQGARMRVRAW